MTTNLYDWQSVKSLPDLSNCPSLPIFVRYEKPAQGKASIKYYAFINSGKLSIVSNPYQKHNYKPIQWRFLLDKELEVYLAPTKKVEIKGVQVLSAPFTLPKISSAQASAQTPRTGAQSFHPKKPTIERTSFPKLSHKEGSGAGSAGAAGTPHSSPHPPRRKYALPIQWHLASSIPEICDVTTSVKFENENNQEEIVRAFFSDGEWYLDGRSKETQNKVPGMVTAWLNIPKQLKRSDGLISPLKSARTLREGTRTPRTVEALDTGISAIEAAVLRLTLNKSNSEDS